MNMNGKLLFLSSIRRFWTHFKYTALAAGGGRGGESTRLKEHLEAEESELYEVKGVLQAKVGCVSMCVHDTL